ncbi:MAG: hypothetical protein AB7F28_06595 [Candidatus Margulisiibacteriota bacterium]
MFFFKKSKPKPERRPILVEITDKNTERLTATELESKRLKLDSYVGRLNTKIDKYTEKLHNLRQQSLKEKTLVKEGLKMMDIDVDESREA